MSRSSLSLVGSLIRRRDSTTEDTGRVKGPAGVPVKSNRQADYCLTRRNMEGPGGRETSAEAEDVPARMVPLTAVHVGESGLGDASTT
jgi:hypothetical protein